MSDTPESESAASAANTKAANRKLAWQLGVFATCSLAFGFALVPLYDVLCEVTGYGNRKTLLEAQEAQPADQQASREVTVEFVSTLPTVGEWQFRPSVTSMKVQTGQLASATFVAKNMLSQPATGQAVPSISPHEASGFFRKTECFCFTPQHFGASEERELTVRFVVDTNLPRNVDRLTLAYSMFGATQQVAAR
jgi:cytochrome c oxidase assembly protein subunit 11